MRKFNQRFGVLLKSTTVIVSIIIAFMMISITLDVLSRYVFNYPLPAIVEINEYLLIYITFLGSAWVLRVNGHVSVDTLVSLLPSKWKGLIHVMTSIIGFLACLALTYYSVLVTMSLYSRGIMEWQVLAIPKWIILICIPIGNLMLSLEFLIDVSMALGQRRAH